MPYITKNGTTYFVDPSAIGAEELTVTTPDVEVTGNAPLFDSRDSAFNGTELTDIADKIMLNTVGKVVLPLTKIPGVLPVLRTITPSNWVGTLRTGIAPWSEQNPGFGTSKNDQALNSLFNYGLSTVPLKASPSTLWLKVKYSKLGEKARGIKVTDEVYHGSRLPFDISKARISNPNTEDSGFHVGSNTEPTLFMANKDFGGVTYKGRLLLKEPAFEVPDFNRWNPYLFWSYAKLNKEFANYLQKHGINYEDFGSMSSDMSKGVLELADKIKNSGIALKYKNKSETLTGNGYSYYLSNPKQAHFTEMMDFGSSNKRRYILSPYQYVRESVGKDLVGNSLWQPLQLKNKNAISVRPNFYEQK